VKESWAKREEEGSVPLIALAPLTPPTLLASLLLKHFRNGRAAPGGRKTKNKAAYGIQSGQRERA
jgi:hypothetical protein